MDDALKKRKIALIAAALVLAGIFGYAIYLLMGEIASAEERYIEKYRELVALEQKQKESVSLEMEFSGTEEQRNRVKQTLIPQTYESKQQLVIEFENMAKALGLQQSLSIAKDITEEDIQIEREQLARSRRGTRGEGVEPENKFPGIVLDVSVTGEYPKVIQFLETLQRLPYYTYMESLNISSGKRAEQGRSSIATAKTQITVFTRR